MTAFARRSRCLRTMPSSSVWEVFSMVGQSGVPMRTPTFAPSTVTYSAMDCSDLQFTPFGACCVVVCRSGKPIQDSNLTN